MFILDSEINFTVKKNIDVLVSMSPAAAFVYNFQF